MFDLLSADGVDHDSIWDLLMKLPMNSFLQERLKSLEFEGEADSWNELFDSKSMHKLHYTLKMIKGLMSDPEWHKQFREKGGLDHLYQVLCNIDMKAQVTSSLRFSCMNLFC